MKNGKLKKRPRFFQIPGYRFRNCGHGFQIKTSRFLLVVLTLPLAVDFILLEDTPVPVNVREDIVLSQNFINRSFRLSYTLSITNSVDRIRAQNVVFERNGFIPSSEQLKYCFVQNNFHICTDNNYPVIWNKDGTVEVQESSRNNDLWLTTEPNSKPHTEIEFDELCYANYSECHILNDPIDLR